MPDWSEAVAWGLPLLVIVVLSFVGPVIPIEFSLLFIGSDVGALGTIPVTIFAVTGFAYLLSAVFVHGLTRPFGGTGTFDATTQVVGFALAPMVLLFLPVALAGFQFLPPLVVAAALPVMLGIATLLYFGVSELHDLGRGASIGVVAGTALLWLLTVGAVSLELAGVAA